MIACRYSIRTRSQSPSLQRRRNRDRAKKIRVSCSSRRMEFQQACATPGCAARMCRIERDAKRNVRGQIRRWPKRTFHNFAAQIPNHQIIPPSSSHGLRSA
jgi:hypothetical protein